MKDFLTWMAHQRDDQVTFFDVFDIRDALLNKNTDDSTVVFVDIGGAKGHQCVALKKRSPDLAGRVVLQDQPEVLEEARTNPLPGFQGIETQAYNLWSPQHLKGNVFTARQIIASILISDIGARSYYLRNVLHDWPDEKCIEMIRNIRVGMTEDSVLLIDEMVLPENGTSWRAAQMDVLMMSTLAAVERTEAEWRSLFDRAGFKIVKTLAYNPHHHDAVLVAIPK